MTDSITPADREAMRVRINPYSGVGQWAATTITSLLAALDAAEKENERLRNWQEDIPDAGEFLSSLDSEARHQRRRWGEEHDRAKSPEDWFWTLGYLSGKALCALRGGDVVKYKHHLVTSAALLMNEYGIEEVSDEPR